jgi:hypothetical protein
VAYFYCQFGDPERSGFLPLARALLLQLLMQDESLLLFFESTMSTHGGFGILSSLDTALQLLETALSSRKTYIILDGLDECGRDQRKHICTWFRDLVDSLPRRKQDEIRCLFISQDDGIARKDLSMLSVITVSPGSNVDDITVFTRQWQAKIEERFGPLQNEGLDLTRIVPARSQGQCSYSRIRQTMRYLTSML